MKKFLAFLFLPFLSICTFAQITYIDLTPDVILQSPYNLDLNKDSILDFTYERYQYWGDHYYYLTPNSNSFFITNNGFIDTLNINDAIGFIMEVNPFERVGERWSFNPIFSIKSRLVEIISSGV